MYMYMYMYMHTYIYIQTCAWRVGGYLCVYIYTKIY